jgi:FAD/FMN-containing dehydrogenase
MDTKAFDNYRKKIERLKRSLNNAAHENVTLSLKKTTSNLFRQRPRRSSGIDVRPFNQVIYVDEQAMLVDVEGMTTYDDFTKATLKKNVLPTVVPELKSITIGGALSGIGIESSSFHYGLVHETVTEFDLLTSEGEVILCRPDNEHSELFFAFPNSYGSLGYALRVQVKLIKVKPFIRLDYHRYTNSEVYFSSLKKTCMLNRQSKEVAYIDGVIFAKDNFVMCLASFVDSAPFVSDYTYMKIYYQSLKTKKVDYMTTYDYIWRWDADWFWCSRAFFMQNKIVRLFFGRWTLRSTMYWKIKKFIFSNSIAKRIVKKVLGTEEQVIQDVVIPAVSATAYFDFFTNQIGIYPIWTCPTYPMRDQDHCFSLFPMQANQLYINFGFWSSVPSREVPGHYNRLIEKKVTELNGNKSLYSDVYYSEAEFWSIYDKENYQKLREKYDPNKRFKDLYVKCVEKNVL